MSRRQGSIFWSLILISVGVLFLLSNLDFDIRPWPIIAKYWPILIIFWGLSKLISYFRSSEDPAVGRRSFLTGGDVVLLLFLLILGTAINKAVPHGFWRPGGLGIHINDDELELFTGPGNIFTFIEEASKPLTSRDVALEILNQYGSLDVNIHDLPEVKIRMEKKVKARDEVSAKEVAETLRIQIKRRSQGYAISSNRDDLDKEKRSRIKTNFSILVPRSIALTLSNKYGAVTLSGAAGNHNLENGYGAVTVKNVDGSLRVENKYGAIYVSNVTGNCDVHNKYGAIELESIGGKTQIEHGYGSISLKQLKGPVELVHKYGKVDCSDLDSALSVDGRYVEVKGINIGGDVQVTSSYKSINLENVQGGMIIHGKHGDVSINGLRPPSRPITIDSEYSAVTITLPRESAFQIDAYSKYGKLISEFDPLNGVTPSDFSKGLRVRGSHGGGGPLITINTSYRDIHLNAS